jgi:hypothetical protein
LGRPTWECGQADVSKAFRRLSVLVHPDKNPGPEARAAFEALNETHRMLKDPSRLVRCAVLCQAEPERTSQRCAVAPACSQ